MKRLVIGIGNADRGDDAAGLLVARRLRERGIEAREHSGDALALLESWAGVEHVILVDTVVTGSSPGTILDAAEARLLRSRQSSSHGFGVAEALALGRVLGRLPSELRIYGIEGASFEPGAPVSAAVLEAVNELAGRIEISSLSRARVVLHGAVQGVGFRPFVYRLATEMDLNGSVLNSSAGLILEIEGERGEIGRFLARLETERPAAAVVLSQEVSWLAPAGFSGFKILESDEAAAKTASVLPDLATCPECVAELLDPADRRFQYPFTNCTRCGPRYTIVLDIPYDRPRTTMREFTMCPACAREYTNPADRRFHAQPNACPVCGPRLSFECGARNSACRAGTLDGDRLREAAEVLAAGHVLALKGIGGFQLLVDARNEAAVAGLRQKKHREEKPFALMMPSLDAVRRYCEVSEGEERLLRSPAAPIVLLRPRAGGERCAPNVAHNSPYLGVMLPYSPLHQLLMREFPFPVVATSGNLSDEPIAIENEEARARLGGIADAFLMHDRPIARPCDDSVVQLVRGRESVMRRARGYAPLGVRVARSLPRVLAVGGHLKNTVAIGVGREVFVSQYVGDLDTLAARRAFERAIDDLCRLYEFKPELVACDLHPDYASTHWALASGLPIVQVQHHHAHAASCAAENDVRGPYLAVSWDGTGYGLDGSIWGGEFFWVEDGRFERVAHPRPFRLPGGEAAIRQGWRAEVSLLHEAGRLDDRFFNEAKTIRRMLDRGLNSPWTTSVGRLFDAVSSMAGLARESRFEGQAAMLLEWAIGNLKTDDAYPLPEKDGVADWRPMVEAIRSDASGAASIAAKFHNTLANWIVAVTARTGAKQVVLSGGVFQNGYLTERAAALLEARGVAVFTHQRVPANDGGIALGQAVLAERR
jgi:hydrogenase maturation protein HypF